MTLDELRAKQTPLKKLYTTEPDAALYTLEAEGKLGEGITCHVPTDAGVVEAGLHPATGGDGSEACSGDMLLQALVACAGVTMRSVATALRIDIRSGTLRAEGDLDFRGTMAVSKEVPVGFKSIHLHVTLDTDASDDQLDTLMRLTERYCVVMQTIMHAVDATASYEVVSQTAGA